MSNKHLHTKMPHSPIFPFCGQKHDGSGRSWTPRTVILHEAGCIKCQELGDAAIAHSQSDYLARKRSVEYEELELPWADEDEFEFDDF